MGDEYKKPQQSILDEISADIEQMENVPPGNYAIYLNDHFIDKETAVGTKENTLERGYPDEIIKE